MALRNKYGAFAPVVLLFIIVNTLAIVFHTRWTAWNVDQDVLIIGNLFLFLITLVSFFIAKKGLRNPNPHAFTRSVMGSIMVKMFLAIIAAFIYISIYKKGLNKPALFRLHGTLPPLYVYGGFLAYTPSSHQAKCLKKKRPFLPCRPTCHRPHLKPVMHYLHAYKVHLTIARERKSILGDYRHRHAGHTHRISVNGNLNQYAFLITLLHELAHLLTFEKWGNKVAAHGKEWKAVFGSLLTQFIEHDVFPADIKRVLLQSLHNPAASSCADEALLRTLKVYDDKKNGASLFVESLPPGALFKTADGRVFQKGEKLRKRYRCVEVKTKRAYLFSGVYEVEVAG